MTSAEDFMDQLVNRRRRILGLTQDQVAKATGVSRPRVSILENNELGRIRIDKLERYVAALGGQLTLQVTFPDDPHEEGDVST